MPSGWLGRLTTQLRRVTCCTVSGLAALSALAQSDLSFPPATSSGHDFNHSPIGQSFTAVASDVRAGIYLADETSFTEWLSTVYPGQIVPGSYPYAVAPSVTVQVDLIQGEGAGTVLHSTTRTLTAPFSGFVDVDYGAAGVLLDVGAKYTLLLTDVSAQSYELGVTGWVVPAVHDHASGTGQPVTDGSGNVVGHLPFGAYPDGQPILQGALIDNDAGVGDNAFQVIANTVPAVETVSGVNAVITAYAPRSPGFIVINGGLNLNDHLWTTDLNPGNTVFLGGLVNWFQTGLLVDYTGTVTPQGVVLTHLTVKPAPTPLDVAGSFPAGIVGTSYNGSLSISGGVAPYAATADGLPAGLDFDGVQITGTPIAAGTYPLTITVTDALGSTIVVSPSITITAPVVTANYSVKDEGKSKVTAVGNGFLMVGAKKVVWNAATLIKVNTPSGERSVIDSAVKPGMRIQWKGLRDPKTNTVLGSKIEVN